MTQKKLLMIVNPRAGRSKPMAPLFDACSALSEAGWLLSLRQTAGTGDRWFTGPANTPVGLFLGDYFARPSKRSGAWMSAFRSQERLNGDITPIIVNVKWRSVFR